MPKWPSGPPHFHTLMPGSLSRGSWPDGAVRPCHSRSWALTGEPGPRRWSIRSRRYSGRTLTPEDVDRQMPGKADWRDDVRETELQDTRRITPGYGTAGADVPPPIREALLMCVGDMHSNREGSPARREKVGESEIERFSPTEVLLPAKQLLQTYKVWKL